MNGPMEREWPRPRERGVAEALETVAGTERMSEEDKASLQGRAPAR